MNVCIRWETHGCVSVSPQLHMTITPKSVKLNVDCRTVAEKELKEARNVSVDGTETLGKMRNSKGSATVSKIPDTSLRSQRRSFQSFSMLLSLDPFPLT